MTNRARQLCAAALLAGVGVAVLSACAVGLAVHAVAMGFEALFGDDRSELAGEHENA